MESAANYSSVWNRRSRKTQQTTDYQKKGKFFVDDISEITELKIIDDYDTSSRENLSNKTQTCFKQHLKMDLVNGKGYDPMEGLRPEHPNQSEKNAKILMYPEFTTRQVIDDYNTSSVDLVNREGSDLMEGSRLGHPNRNFFAQPQDLLQKLNDYSYLDKSFKEAFNRIAKEHNVPIYGCDLPDIIEWLESPVDPKEMPLEAQSRFIKLYQEEVERLIGYSENGVVLEIPKELEGKALIIFKDRAQRYFIKLSETIQSIQDVHDWLGKHRSELNILPTAQWKKNGLIVEFSAALKALKENQQVELYYPTEDIVEDPEIIKPDLFPKDGPFGTVKEIPPYSKEEREARTLYGSEKKAAGNFKPYGPKAIPLTKEERTWV